MWSPKGGSLRLAQALPANIGLGWKGLPWTNTLAYLLRVPSNNEKVLSGKLLGSIL